MSTGSSTRSDGDDDILGTPGDGVKQICHSVYSSSTETMETPERQGTPLPVHFQKSKPEVNVSPLELLFRILLGCLLRIIPVQIIPVECHSSSTMYYITFYHL
jgi:hypothetical protein